MIRRRLVTLLIVVVLAISNVSLAGRQADKAAAVEREVREVFDKWSTALIHGDKKTYLDTFWNSPRLVIRVASGEWHGLDSYRKRIEAAQLPPGNATGLRKVEVVALGTDAAVVTYERPAPAQANVTAGESLVFRGTVAFTRTPDGWKIAAWHAHSVTEKGAQ